MDQTPVLLQHFVLPKKEMQLICFLENLYTFFVIMIMFTSLTALKFRIMQTFYLKVVSMKNLINAEMY